MMFRSTRTSPGSSGGQQLIPSSTLTGRARQGVAGDRLVVGRVGHHLGGEAGVPGQLPSAVRWSVNSSTRHSAQSRNSVESLPISATRCSRSFSTRMACLCSMAREVGLGAEVVADGGVVALPGASLTCRLDTAKTPCSANSRSAATGIASRVRLARSVQELLEGTGRGGHRPPVNRSECFKSQVIDLGIRGLSLLRVRLARRGAAVDQQHGASDVGERSPAKNSTASATSAAVPRAPVAGRRASAHGCRPQFRHLLGVHTVRGRCDDGGPDVPGRKTVDADLVRRQLDRRTLGEVDDRRLRGPVGQHTAAGLDAADRRQG